MNNDQFHVMLDVFESIMRAVRTRDVSAEFGLNRLHVTNVHAEIYDSLLHTNVHVKADVSERSSAPVVSESDGVLAIETKNITVEASATFYNAPWNQRTTKLSQAKRVRSVLLDLLTHEVDEILTIEGERVFDPHKLKMPRFAAFKKQLHRLLGKGQDK